MVKMARNKVKNLRCKHVDTRLTEEEFSTIKKKAYSTGVSGSEYLRSLGMNYPLKSVVDQVALDELIKAKSDLGRVGGLFKKWLVNQDNKKVHLGSRSYKEIDLIVEELEKKQMILMDCAKQLLKTF